MKLLPVVLLFLASLQPAFAQSGAGPRPFAGLLGGPAGGDVRVLAVDPRNQKVIYAGTARGAIFRSTDTGDHWQSISAGLPAKQVTGIVVSPKDGKTIYAGYDGAGVYKSKDGGGSWARVDISFASQQVFSIAGDPAAPDTIYAATYDGWVNKTIDGGKTWVAHSLGVKNTFVHSLVINRLKSDTIYAATGGDNHHTKTYGVFRSDDGGVNWRHVNGGLRNDWIFSMVLDPAHPDTLLVGLDQRNLLYRTVDGGQAWSLIQPDPPVEGGSLKAMAIDPMNAARMYLGFGHVLSNKGGIALSADGGLSWTTALPGLPQIMVRTLLIVPSQPNTVLAGTMMGVFKSTDTGKTWKPSSEGLSGSRVNALAVSPASSKVIYAGLEGGGVYRTRDGGESWKWIGDKLPLKNVCAIAVDWEDENLVYAGGDGYEQPPTHLFRSRDAGASWEPLDAQSPRRPCALAVHPLTGRLLRVGDSGDGLFQLTPDGKSWKELGKLPPTGNGRAQVLSVAFARRPELKILVRTRAALLESLDGVSWTVVKDGIEQVLWQGHRPGVAGLGWGQKSWPFAVNPRDSRVMFAASSNDRGESTDIFRTMDGGRNWEAISSSLGSLRMRAMSVDLGNPNIIYAGTDHGIFQSRDWGITWKPTGIRIAHE